MRKVLAIAVATFLFQSALMLQAVQLAQAYDESYSIDVGGPPIDISQPPDFIYPPELGFGVAVDVPYDMFFLDGVYFIYRGGGWYRASSYGNGWVKVRQRELPPQLRRYRISKIHAYRDREFRVYSRDRDHYHGQHFRPEVRGRMEHKDMRERGREERPDMRDQRHEERGGERHER